MEDLKKTILLVDDEPIVVGLLKKPLEMLGYKTLSAKNGVEAFEVSQNTLPDIMVLDMNMPIMDGAQTMALFKSDKRVSNIPVIIYSAHIEDPEKMKLMGAVCVVNKSLGFKVLADCVSRYLQDLSSED